MKNYRTFFRLSGLYLGGLFISLVIFLGVINYFVNPPIDKDIDRYIFAKYEFKTQDGNSINLSREFGGNTYLVDFWTMGCSFCIDDLRQFYELDLSKNPNFYIAAINKDEFEKWDTYLQQSGFKTTSQIMHLNLTDKSILDKLDVEFFPTYFLVDEAGKIKSRCSYNFVIAKVKRLLGEDSYFKDFVESLYGILPCEGLQKPIMVYTLVVYPILLITYFVIKRRKQIKIARKML